MHPDHSHSVQAVSDSWPNSVAISGMIACSLPGVKSPSPEEPTCSVTTVSVSAQARRIGSQ